MGKDIKHDDDLSRAATRIEVFAVVLAVVALGAIHFFGWAR